MVKDRIGNELKKGDLLEIQLANNIVIAEVHEIDKGGMIGQPVKDPKNPQKAAVLVKEGKLICVCTVEIPYDPTQADVYIATVIKAVKPESQKSGLLQLQ